MIVICHESPSVRSLLREQISSIPGVDRVTTSASVEDLMVRIASDKPSMIFLPLEKASQLATKLLNGDAREAIVAITVPQPRRVDLDSVRTAAAAGVRGFLRSDARPQEVTALVREGLAQQRPAQIAAVSEKVLTKRELEVLNGMSRGRSNAEIGRELFLSEDTIKTHARRLFRKLGAHDRAQAVAVGFRMGLLN